MADWWAWIVNKETLSLELILGGDGVLEGDVASERQVIDKGEEAS